MNERQVRMLTAAVLFTLGSGCTGITAQDDAESRTETKPSPSETNAAMPGRPPVGPGRTDVPSPKDSDPAGGPHLLSSVGGLRLLSRTEYDNTLQDLLGDRTRAGSTRLPEPVITPDIAFDNDIGTQQVTAQLISATESLAQEAASRALKDPDARKALVPCTPTDPQDAACLRTVITTFGRRAFRRPLTEDDIKGYLEMQRFGLEQRDFYVVVELVVRAMLQDPEFLYRVELGTPIPGKKLYKLNGYEMASRLSYFLRGTTPDETLLGRAAANKLSTPDEVRDATNAMMSDARIREQVQRFHAQWLSYDEIPHPATLATAMRAETRALIDRVIFTQPSSYLDLFVSKETFVGEVLAKHYGLPIPSGGKAAWVPYGNAARLGILSHGAVLSATTKAGDTSPVLRGRFISTRLMCRPIPPPPPNVDADTAPKGDSACKKDKLRVHAESPACAGCHAQMDPIGFGLENYDREGKFRTREAGAPACAITGEGTLPNVGVFKGADGLARELTTSGRIEDCVARELYRFATGRQESDDELTDLRVIIEKFRSKKSTFRDLLLDLVSSNAFGYRHDDSTEGS